MRGAPGQAYVLRTMKLLSMTSFLSRTAFLVAAAALSLAFNMACGSKLQFGTMAKPLHAGLAAQHGVMAAELAAAGVRGIAEPLEGTWGFRDLFAGVASPGYSAQPVGRPLGFAFPDFIRKVLSATYCPDGRTVFLKDVAVAEAGIAALLKAIG